MSGDGTFRGILDAKLETRVRRGRKKLIDSQTTRIESIPAVE